MPDTSLFSSGVCLARQRRPLVPLPLTLSALHPQDRLVLKAQGTLAAGQTGGGDDCTPLAGLSNG